MPLYSSVGHLESDFTLENRQFTAVTIFTTGSVATEVPVYLFRNQTGSGKTVYIKWFALVVAATAVTQHYDWRVYKTPTVTATGTAVTKNNTHIGDGTVSAIQVFSTPTISANGTLMRFYVTTIQSPTPVIDQQYTLVVDDGQDLLITLTPTTTGNTASCGMMWVEI